MKNDLLQLFQSNRWYFGCAAVFLLVGLIHYLTAELGDLIFFFSDRRSTFWNLFFIYATRLGEEGPYIIATLSLLFVRFGYALLIPVTGGIVALFSKVLKNFFLQARPGLYYRELGRLEEINLIADYPLLGGLSSFPSGHTLSAFALMTLLALIVTEKRLSGLAFFFAAFLVALSRVYLVAHFFKDVLFGAIFGILTAIFIYLAWQNFAGRKPNHPLNRSLSVGRGRPLI